MTESSSLLFRVLQFFLLSGVLTALAVLSPIMSPSLFPLRWRARLTWVGLWLCYTALYYALFNPPNPEDGFAYTILFSLPILLFSVAAAIVVNLSANWWRSSDAINRYLVEREHGEVDFPEAEDKPNDQEGNTKAPEVDFTEALAIVGPLRDKFYVPGTLPDHQGSAEIQQHRESLENAIALLRRARTAKLTQGHSGQRDAAVALHEVGMALRLLGDLDNARATFLEAHSEMQRNADLYHGWLMTLLHPIVSRTVTNDLGVCSLHLGEVEHLSHNTEHAKTWYKQAIKLFRESSDEDNLRLTIDLSQRA